METQKGQVDKSGDRENRDFWHILPCVSVIRSSLTLNKNSVHKGLRSSPNREFRENLCETHPFGGRMADSLRSLPGGTVRRKSLSFSHKRRGNKKSSHKGLDGREQKKWSGRLDSNQRPLRPERSAPTRLSYAPTIKICR